MNKEEFDKRVESEVQRILGNIRVSNESVRNDTEKYGLAARSLRALVEMLHYDERTNQFVVTHPQIANSSKDLDVQQNLSKLFFNKD